MRLACIFIVPDGVGLLSPGTASAHVDFQSRRRTHGTDSLSTDTSVFVLWVVVFLTRAPVGARLVQGPGDYWQEWLRR